MSQLKGNKTWEFNYHSVSVSQHWLGSSVIVTTVFKEHEILQRGTSKWEGVFTASNSQWGSMLLARWPWPSHPSPWELRKGKHGYVAGGYSLHWIPKLSASVKYSLASPDHCLVIFPTSWVPSADNTWKDIIIGCWVYPGSVWTTVKPLLKATWGEATLPIVATHLGPEFTDSV